MPGELSSKAEPTSEALTWERSRTVEVVAKAPFDIDKEFTYWFEGHPNKEMLDVDALRAAVNSKLEGFLEAKKGTEGWGQATEAARAYLKSFYYHSLAYLSLHASRRWRMFGDKRQINTTQLINGYLFRFDVDGETAGFLEHSFTFKSPFTTVRLDAGPRYFREEPFGYRSMEVEMVICYTTILKGQGWVEGREAEDYARRIVEVYQGHKGIDNRNAVDVYHWSIYRLSTLGQGGGLSEAEFSVFLMQLAARCREVEHTDPSSRLEIAMGRSRGILDGVGKQGTKAEVGSPLSRLPDWTHRPETETEEEPRDPLAKVRKRLAAEEENRRKNNRLL